MRWPHECAHQLTSVALLSLCVRFCVLLFFPQVMLRRCVGTPFRGCCSPAAQTTPSSCGTSEGAKALPSSCKDTSKNSLLKKCKQNIFKLKAFVCNLCRPPEELWVTTKTHRKFHPSKTITHNLDVIATNPTPKIFTNNATKPLTICRRSILFLHKHFASSSSPKRTAAVFLPQLLCKRQQVSPDDSILQTYWRTERTKGVVRS